MGRKKNQGPDGLDVLTEIKEPFSFSRFFEEQVIERGKRFKKFLEEKGVLYFFLSPFMAKSRLVLELVIIVFGILIGIVPRTGHLIEQARKRNAASEMASLIESDSQFPAGSVLTKPIASSQYGRQHLLAFLLTPAGQGPIPSVPDRYLVQLSANRGVSDPENVTFSYQVLPVSERARLLLVYVDNREQTDTTGIYDLTVQIANEDLPADDWNPMEIVLSDTQQTTELFDESGIHLAALTDAVLGHPGTPIADAEAAYEKALSNYELETERIAALPVPMKAAPTVSEVEAYGESHTLYPGLTDASTVQDLDRYEEVPAGNPTLGMPVSITMNGTAYDADLLDVKAHPEKAAIQDVRPADGMSETVPAGLTEEEKLLSQELTSLASSADQVFQALMDRNQAARNRFDDLFAYRLILSQNVTPEDFYPGGICRRSLSDWDQEQPGDEQVPQAGSIPGPETTTEPEMTTPVETVTEPETTTQAEPETTAQAETTIQAEPETSVQTEPETAVPSASAEASAPAKSTKVVSGP